jgi:predicted Rossmann-fold nucleotide-binding protein
VLFDTEYWREMIDWIRGDLLAAGMIKAADLDLLHPTDDPEEAVDYVLAAYELRCEDDPNPS